MIYDASQWPLVVRVAQLLVRSFKVAVLIFSDRSRSHAASQKRSPFPRAKRFFPSCFWCSFEEFLLRRSCGGIWRSCLSLALVVNGSGEVQDMRGTRPGLWSLSDELRRIGAFFCHRCVVEKTAFRLLVLNFGLYDSDVLKYLRSWEEKILSLLLCCVRFRWSELLVAWQGFSYS